MTRAAMNIHTINSRSLGILTEIELDNFVGDLIFAFKRAQKNNDLLREAELRKCLMHLDYYIAGREKLESFESTIN